MLRGMVAIVGRPNVGKSSCFNYLAGERISIVDDTPGVTRDRIYTRVEWLDREFNIIDTGGLEPDSEDIILKQMEFIGKIENIDKVTPMTFPYITDDKELREDEITDYLTVGEVLENSKHQVDDQVKVPKVVE